MVGNTKECTNFTKSTSLLVGGCFEAIFMKNNPGCLGINVKIQPLETKPIGARRISRYTRPHSKNATLGNCLFLEI
jgi:hypothetical protein